MRFLIQGIDRQTGQALKPIIVEESCERYALEEATQRGMLTESIEVYNPILPPSLTALPPPPVGVRFIDPATSFVTNIFFGVMLFSVGIPLLFCFWPVGAVCMLAGLIVPLYGMAVGTLRGPCPYCGHDVLVGADMSGINCPACKKRIVVRDREFVRID